jgi:hypothetical protein
MKRFQFTPGIGLCAAAVLAIAATGTGCSKSTHHNAAPNPAASSASSSSTPAGTATRWWSNSAVQVGSPIDPANPGADAAKLHQSQADYCGMLKQTVKAGKSLITSAQTADTGVRIGIQAFVPEISKVAPSPVDAQWRVVGPVVLAAAKAGALPSTGAGAATAQALQAVSVVASDAKSRCGLDLTPLIAGATGG